MARGSTTTCCPTRALGTPVAEFAGVQGAQHRVEECLQRAKGEAGLADYEVRWRGWYHHQVLAALVATWFLTVEAGRGEKSGRRRLTVPQLQGLIAGVLGETAGDVAFGVYPSHRKLVALYAGLRKRASTAGWHATDCLR